MKPTARDFELYRMPVVASRLPIQFKNGAEWREIDFYCAHCHIELPAAAVRGSVVRHADHMAAIEAVGGCTQCRTLTRFLFRLYDDMSIASPGPQGWRFSRLRSPGLLAKAKQAIMKMFA